MSVRVRVRTVRMCVRVRACVCVCVGSVLIRNDLTVNESTGRKHIYSSKCLTKFLWVGKFLLRDRSFYGMSVDIDLFMGYL